MDPMDQETLEAEELLNDDAAHDTDDSDVTYDQDVIDALAHGLGLPEDGPQDGDAPGPEGPQVAAEPGGHAVTA